MKWLDRSSTSSSALIPWLVLALAGCSDDGLAPPQDTEITGASAAATTSENDDANGTENPSDSTGLTGPAPTTTDTSGTTGFESDGTGTGNPANVCESPDQCVLVNDCCQCAAAHVDDVIPDCPMDCLVSMCESLGLSDPPVTCIDGACELGPFVCTPSRIVCDSVPPRCPPGTLPGITPEGDCWTGECVPVDACDSVPSCNDCTDGQACIEHSTQAGPVYSCQAMPDECGGVPTCACMPPDTCESPFDQCAELDGVVVCSCLDC